MLRLIIGVKGTGKTKQLLELANEAVAATKGCVVCLEKGDTLRFDMTHKIRLVDTNEYMISDGQSLFGFIAGVFASNHDITDLFVDGALRICKNDMDSFKCFVREVDCFAEKNDFNVIMTSSIPVETADEEIKAYVK